MNIRVASLSFVIAFAVNSLPADAQINGGGRPSGAGATIQSLARELAELTARVAKLEGQIEANDLVGTYVIVGIQNNLQAAGPSGLTEIASYFVAGTLRLAADGIGSALSGDTGAILRPDVPSLVPDGTSPEHESFTWTYDAASGTVTVVSDDGTFPFSVGAGGRVAVLAGGGTDAGRFGGVLYMLIRLR